MADGCKLSASVAHVEAQPSSQAELEADPVTRGRPIALRSKDAHGYWVSRKILDAMEPIPAEVDGGVIIRDPYGQPTGEATSE